MKLDDHCRKPAQCRRGFKSQHIVFTAFDIHLQDHPVIIPPPNQG